MNFLEHFLLLAGLPAAMILAGYWLAAPLTGVSAAERMAVAALAGLGALLWSIATVNFFRPLAGPWAWVCLWPVALTLLTPAARRALVHDTAAVTLHRRGALGLAAAAAFLALLLWPLLSQPALVFYDGTSNHDAFFWISAAEHLKRHTYMVMPVTSPLHPLTNATPAIIGWRPAWGRMGAEGLLALTSSIVGLAPLKLYLCATATLYVPWIAAVFLATRTFFVRRLGILATLALIVLQPMFVFYYGNANLPNLVGALMAAAAVVATERSLRPAAGRGVWFMLLALAVHGLLCSYPEMVPFVVMPAGLLWLRAWFARGPRIAWRPAGAAALAWIAGGAINPASTVRAGAGFLASFDAARANQDWANLFEPLSWAQYGPGLATLSVVASKNIGAIAGGALTVALAVGVALALRRAADRLGAWFTLSGAGALLVYTVATGFNYGWQKTVQFGGAFWAALLPVAVIEALLPAAASGGRLRHLYRAALAGVVAFFGYATIVNCLDGHQWARRKVLTQDWFSLRDYAREHLPDAPVLIDGASFRMAFFHGMWAAYFLADSDIYFAARGEENGGYLRAGVINEATSPVPPPAGYLVSREWADTFDANSTRLQLGDTVALLRNANRVMHWTGFYPDNGVPTSAQGRITIELRPHDRSRFELTLAPGRPTPGGATRWTVTARVDGQPGFRTEVSGPPPWRLVVPLVAGRLNHLEFAADPTPAPANLPPFAVRALRIVTVRK